MNTICAVSTAPGVGGIAVVRVSGADALAVMDKLFHGKHPLSEAKANTIHYGHLMAGDEVLDEVLCSIFRAPHSFTGEDTVEIACHGSLYIQQTILEALVNVGCTLARPGEFTQRAFLNGKMDLTQAEAVADLIAAQSEAEKKMALSHLKGGVSKELSVMREQLLTLTSLLELELDFADHEDLTFADRGELERLAQAIHQHLNGLIDSFRLGNAIKHGIPVAIIGPTNAGKSTLLNALLGEDKAIVSDIPGTTRDAIEDTLFIHGVQFRFIDTAGLRATDDTIEAIGIQRSMDAARKAEVIIYVQDATAEETPLPEELAQKTIIRVYNKADLLSQPRAGLCISAKRGEVDAIKEALYNPIRTQLEPNTGLNHNTLISSTRHYEALVRAREAILRVEQGMADGLSGEFLSMDLHDCLNALGEITGEITNDEVLGNIFSKFCIGK